MKRRDFITLLGGAAAWPIAAGDEVARLAYVRFRGSADKSRWIADCLRRE